MHFEPARGCETDNQAAIGLRLKPLPWVKPETRRMFRTRLEEVTALSAEGWEDDHLLDELNKALVLLENIRADYNKALAKIDAIQPAAARGSAGGILAFADAPGAGPGGRSGFGYWLRAGLAFTLPLMVLLVFLLVAWMVFDYWG